MDSGLTVRPTSAAPQAAGVRQDATPVREAVATHLAPAQTVTAAAKTSEARQDPLQSESADPSYVRKIILDAQSREVIYRVVDVKSGRVVRQIPEEVLLRLRAYNRAMAEKEDSHSSIKKTV
jgi:uncharacterized FlaG/YvyC family protein